MVFGVWLARGRRAVPGRLPRAVAAVALAVGLAAAFGVDGAFLAAAVSGVVGLVLAPVAVLVLAGVLTLGETGRVAPQAWALLAGWASALVLLPLLMLWIFSANLVCALD